MKHMAGSLRAQSSDTFGVEKTAGTESEFDDFFREGSGTLYRALCLATGDRQEAEDILQVAYLKVFERWDRVRRMERPDGFLYRVAMNEFRSRYRRIKVAIRHATVSMPTAAFFEEAIEDRHMVIRALSDLAPKQRAAVVLTVMVGYSSDEAGALLGISPAAVRQLGSRARASLRESLEETDDRRT